MKLNKNILILLSLILTGCINNNNPSPSVNNSNSQSENSSSIVGNWEQLGFEDIYEMNFKVEFISRFNDEEILVEKERSELYMPEQGTYIDDAMDHYYYLYEESISKEHTKVEQKDVNTFKIESDSNFQDVWVENVYKLHYDESNKLVKTCMQEISFYKTQNSVVLNLEKDEECVGYYFEIKAAYIVKDIRGFMYYISSMVLF